MIAGANQVAQEILVSLAAGSHQVGAPDKHIAWEVAGVVRVIAGHFDATRGNAIGHIVIGRFTGSFGITRQLQRIGLELR